MSRRAERTVAGLALVCAIAALPAGTARADPAGPTDFETRVVSVTPATPQIGVDALGGDTFVRLRAARGTDVVVLGYWGEQYVHILPDGSVHQNRRSPTVAQNESRYGAAATVGTAADIAGMLPEWEVVGGGGTFVWHDHRAHLMSPDPPSDAEAGDPVAEGVIALVVDGRPVDVRVVTVLQQAPSPAPTAAGALAGAFAALILLSSRKRQAWLLGAAGAVAAGIGWWQFDSLPPETGPSTTSWVLPAAAAASAALALASGRSLASHALVLLGGLELGVWVYLRREGLVRALLPTDAPFWLDRGVTAGAAVAAVAAIAAGGIALFRYQGPALASPPRRSGDGVTTWGRARR